MISLPAHRLTRASLAYLAWLALVGCTPHKEAQADDKPKAGKPTVKALIQKAIEAANDDNFTAAITTLDQALKQEPEDRKALFVASVLANVGADKAKTEDYKLAMLRKSTASYAKLRNLYKDLTPEEASFADRAEMNEARVLALDDKPKPALDALVRMVGRGGGDLAAIEKQKDLKAVRALPNFREKLDGALQEGVKAMIARFESFPFDFDLKGLDDKSVKLADFIGKVTIVDIWGTWCPPCREEIPHFIDLVSKYEGQGLRIVGINTERGDTPAENKKLIKDFIDETKINYPCVLNDGNVEEKVPGFQGYPTTLFLDRAGKVRLVTVGYTQMPQLEAIVKSMLAEPSR